MTMEWCGRRLLALAMLALCLVGVGCSGAPSRTGPLPDLPPALDKQPAPSSARTQKPEPRDNPLHIDDKGQPHGARIVAVVNNQAILDDDVFAVAIHQLAGIRSQEEKDKLIKEKVDEIIDRELVIQDAERTLGGEGK